MNKVCKSSDWLLKLRAKRKPRFKPGTEMSEKVNIMNVDIKEDSDEFSESTSVDLSLEKESKEKIDFSLTKKRKTRFKAGSDLTEKVNEMEVDLLEEIHNDFEVSKLKMKLETDKKEILQVSVKKRNKTRFKAGADLTDKVNHVEIEMSEEIEEDFEVCEIAIRLKSNACTLLESAAELN